MKITFIGAAHEVTGSCTLVEVAGKKFLVDCGMEQGPNIYENRELTVSPADIDFVFLTHAHIDHSGKLPLLVKNGFHGKIYSTDATRKLCAVMLSDSAHIQMSDAEWKNRRATRSGSAEYEPLYTQKDVDSTMALFEPFGYGMEFFISDGIVASFFDSGHLLGSSSIKFRLTEGKHDCTVIFSGDIGNSERPLLRDPQMPDEADVVIIESTYGDRTHDKKRPDYEQKLIQLITETFDKGGNLVIPSFAVGRTQELLYMLRGIKERKAVNYDFPVYLDSPLAIEATKIYASPDMQEYYDDETLALLGRDINPITFDGLHISVTTEESKAINFDPTPKVIIASSGMCEAGRIRHHLKHNLWREECTILFVGYQAEGTLGRKIIEGASSVNLFGEEVQVNASIEKMQGISGHADKNMLLSWLGSIEQKPKVVFVNHGHDTVCDEFAKSIENELEISALAPYSGDGFELGDVVKQVDIGPRKLYDKKLHKVQRNNTVYDRLYLAGQNLMSVIEASKGCTNKDLSRLTDQIIALCEKYKQD